MNLWEISGREWSRNLGLFILRILFGMGIAYHGFSKMGAMPEFIEGVAQLGFPVPTLFAWAAVLSEFLGGIMVAAGIFTRIGAFSVGATMFVAAFVRHAEDPFSQKEKALAYLVVAVFIILAGAGRYSLDRVLFAGTREES